MVPHQLITELIRATKKSTLQVAAEMDKPSFQGTLHKFASGNVPNPSHATARKIADYFNLPIEAIYDKSAATHIARERGLIADKTERGRAHHIDEPAVAPHKVRQIKPARTLNDKLLDRISALDDVQLQALESVIKSFLDAVSPAAKVSKAKQA